MLPCFPPIFVDLRHDAPKRHDSQVLGKYIYRQKLGAFVCDSDGAVLNQFSQQGEA